MPHVMQLDTIGLALGKSVKVFGPNIAASKASWNPRTDREGTVFPRDAGKSQLNACHRFPFFQNGA